MSLKEYVNFDKIKKFFRVDFHLFEDLVRKLFDIEKAEDLKKLTIAEIINNNFSVRYTFKYLTKVEDKDEFKKEICEAVFEVFLKKFIETTFKNTGIFSEKVFSQFLNLYIDFSKFIFKDKTLYEKIEKEMKEKNKEYFYYFFESIKNTSFSKNDEIMLVFLKQFEIVLLEEKNDEKDEDQMIVNKKEILKILKKSGFTYKDEIKEILEHLKNNVKNFKEKGKFYLDLLEFFKSVKDDKNIQDLVLEIANVKFEIFKSKLEREKFLLSYCNKYKDNLQLQNLIPGYEASKNICFKGFEDLQSSNFEESEKKFLLSIEKNENNEKAHEGLYEIYKMKKKENPKRFSDICFKIFQKFKKNLSDEKKIHLLNEAYQHNKENIEAFIEYKILLNLIPSNNKIKKLEKELLEKNSVIENFQNQLKNVLVQVSTQKIQLAELQIGKTFKKIVTINTRNENCVYFNLSGMCFKLQIFKGNIFKLFHNLNGYTVSIKEGFIKLFEKKDGLGIEKVYLNSMKLSCPISEQGWKLFNFESKKEVLGIEIQVCVSSIVKN